jgi:hypothetical protein
MNFTHTIIIKKIIKMYLAFNNTTTQYNFLILKTLKKYLNEN